VETSSDDKYLYVWRADPPKDTEATSSRLHESFHQLNEEACPNVVLRYSARCCAKFGAQREEAESDHSAAGNWRPLFALRSKARQSLATRVDNFIGSVSLLVCSAMRRQSSSLGCGPYRGFLSGHSQSYIGLRKQV